IAPERVVGWPGLVKCTAPASRRNRSPGRQTKARTVGRGLSAGCVGPLHALPAPATPNGSPADPAGELDRYSEEQHMGWEWLKRWVAKERGKEGAETPELLQVRWLAPADNPWGVPVLDVRPVTLGMLSTSRDQQCALNAMSFT